MLSVSFTPLCNFDSFSSSHPPPNETRHGSLQPHGHGCSLQEGWEGEGEVLGFSSQTFESQNLWLHEGQRPAIDLNQSYSTISPDVILPSQHSITPLPALAWSFAEG